MTTFPLYRFQLARLHFHSLFHLRRIKYIDPETGKRFVFLTNNFVLDALENAVKTQVWIAISVYVLVAIVKKELRLERSMSEILQILSLMLFEKTQLFEALSCKNATKTEGPSHNHLSLFDF